MDRRAFLKSSALFSLVGKLPSCATNPVTGEQDLMLLNEDEEAELGSSSHKKVMKMYRPYDNPQQLEYSTE